MSAPPRGDWNAIKALFLEVVELGPEARAAVLAGAGGGDEGLRAEVESLLAAHDDERPFLDVQPVAGAARALRDAFDQTEAREIACRRARGSVSTRCWSRSAPAVWATSTGHGIPSSIGSSP